MAWDLRRNFRASLIDYIKNILGSKDFIARNRTQPTAFVRKRKLPFDRLFWLIANFRNRSMQSEIAQFLEDSTIEHEHVEKLDDSSVFHARQKLSPQAYQEMNEHCLAFAQLHGQLKLWKGYQLCALDGSTLRLPAEGDIPEMFPPHTDKRGDPVGPPLARISLLYDPLNKLSLSAELDPTEVAEMDQLRDHRWHWQAGQLLLADRHYGAFWVFAWLLKRKVDFCIRLTVGQRKLTRQFVAEGLAEKVVVFKPGRRARKKCRGLGLSLKPISLRLVRVELSSGEVEVLVTSVLESEKISAKEFGKLYHMRWPVEEKFKQLKFRINLENWSGKSAWTIYQDTFARIWACNLTVLLAQGLEEEIERRTGHRKYPYQINWAGAFATTKRHLIKLVFRGTPAIYLKRISERFLEQLSPIRVDRKYEHNHKRYKREFYMCYKFCC